MQPDDRVIPPPTSLVQGPRPKRTRLFGVPEHVEKRGGTLEPGTLAGDYRIDRHLADGGMASVYEATHPVIGKHAAVKVLNEGLSRSEQIVGRFLTEARAVNQIQHPNIVDIFAFGQLDDGRHYLVMELLAGETLYARMEREPLSTAESIELLIQVCDALEAAHAEQIAHLDLKPENIFIVPVRGARPRVKLLDFGIAKLVGLESREVSGDFCGTPDYASPEQAQGLESIDHRSDVYSLGIVAYELAAGTRPFLAEQAMEILWKHIRQQPAKPSVYRSVPVELEALILSMLAKDADERPTMTQVRERLEALKTPSMVLPILRTPSLVLELLHEPETRRPGARMLGLGAAALAMTCGIGIRLAMHHGRVEARAEAAAASPIATQAPVLPASGTTAPILLSGPTGQIASTGTAGPAVALRSKHHKKVRIAATPAGSDYVLDYAGKPR